MEQITPSRFWTLYKEQLKQIGNWEAYQSCPEWTNISVRAAKDVCEALGLETDNTFRLDVCGYESRNKMRHDWWMRVAFEVENSPHWKDELCKLAHVVSGLCVLSAYQNHENWRAEEALEEYLRDMHDRVQRVANRQWLFIFGPKFQNSMDQWTAYTIDSKSKLISVDAGEPLRGIDLLGQRAP